MFLLGVGREIWRFLWNMWKSQERKWVHLTEFLLPKLYIGSNLEMPLPACCSAWSHVENEAGTESRILIARISVYVPFFLWAVSGKGDISKIRIWMYNLNQIVLLVDDGHYSCLGSPDSGLPKLWVLDPKNYSSNVSLVRERRREVSEILQFMRRQKLGFFSLLLCIILTSSVCWIVFCKFI